MTGDPAGSLKHSATASPSSGEGTPRRRMSCLLSSCSWPALLYLYPTDVSSPCNESRSGSEKRPDSAVLTFDHNSARRLQGPPPGLPASSKTGGSIGLPAPLTPRIRPLECCSIGLS